AGCGYGTAPLRRRDRAGDAAGEALLTESADQRAELALWETRDQLGGSLAVAAHAHVERAVLAKRKAALALIQLHRRHSEVERDAGDWARRKRPDQPLHLAERAGDQGQPATVFLGERLTAGDRVGVAVDAKDAAASRAEDRLAVAAGTKGRVDIGRVVARRE